MSELKKKLKMDVLNRLFQYVFQSRLPIFWYISEIVFNHKYLKLMDNHIHTVDKHGFFFFPMEKVRKKFDNVNIFGRKL